MCETETRVVVCRKRKLGFTICGLRSNSQTHFLRPKTVLSPAVAVPILLCRILQCHIQSPDKSLAAVELFFTAGLWPAILLSVATDFSTAVATCRGWGFHYTLVMI